MYMLEQPWVDFDAMRQETDLVIIPTGAVEVYGHHLESSEGVVEWVKGSLLTDYEKRMPADLYARYLARYRERLLAEIGAKAPYFYAFKRVLARGRKRG